MVEEDAEVRAKVSDIMHSFISRLYVEGRSAIFINVSESGLAPDS